MRKTKKYSRKYIPTAGIPKRIYNELSDEGKRLVKSSQNKTKKRRKKATEKRALTRSIERAVRSAMRPKTTRRNRRR